MAHADTGNSIIKNNAKMRGHSVKRLRKIRELYVGHGNKNQSKNIVHLTPEEISLGRKRAKIYYTKRNVRIYTQTVVVLILSLGLVALIVWFVLGDGLTSYFNQ